VTGILLGLTLLIGATGGWAGVIATVSVSGISLVGGGRRLLWTILLIPAALIGCMRVGGQEALVLPDLPSGELRFEAAVESRPVENGRSQRFEIVISGRDNDVAGSFRLCATAPLVPTIGFKDRIQIAGNGLWIDEVDDRTAGFLKSRRCVGSLAASHVVVLEGGTGASVWLDKTRRRMTSVLQRAVPGDSGALLAGLVTGDDTALPFDRRDDFIVTGTSHITAVSGSNLAVIVTILTVAGGAAGIARRWPWQMLTIVALWLYVGIIGPTAPPFRAACVATLAVIATWIGRRPDFVTLSVLVAAVELLWRPADLESLAFRLSTVSAIALVLGLSGRTPKGARGWVTQSMYSTAATQAATAVFLIPLFGRFAIYSIPANLAIASLCTITFPLALIAGIAGLASSNLAAAIAAPASIPASIVLKIARFFAGLPGANLGSALGQKIDPWIWAMLGTAAVVMLSKECRGGLTRISTTVASSEIKTRAVIAGSAAGTLIGAIAGAIVR
jgi:ComEC/Rec2-related protein